MDGKRNTVLKAIPNTWPFSFKIPHKFVVPAKKVFGKTAAGLEYEFPPFLQMSSGPRDLLGLPSSLHYAIQARVKRGFMKEDEMYG